MRVKVGGKWIEAMPDHPIAVEFNARDVRNLETFIADPSFTRYAEYHTDDPRSKTEREAWLKE